MLIEIAAKLAAESGTLILGSRHIPDKSLEEYWISSRCRLQRWQIELKAVEVDLRNHPKQSDRIWLRAESTMSEVLQAEVLTRVWSAILNGIEQMCPVKDCDPIGRSTLIGHLEARNRVLRLLMSGKTLGIAAANCVNEMRLQTERWTDLLLAMVAEHVDVVNFGFNQQRVRDLAADRIGHAMHDRQTFDALSIASLKDYYSRNGCRYSANAQWNKSLASAVLSSIDGNLFRSTGNLMPLWQTRMLLTTSETYGALEELLDMEREPDNPSVDHLVNRRF